MRLLYRIIRLIDAISWAVSNAALILVFTLMVVTIYEVVMRYVFNAPTIWVMELSGYLMLLFVALGGAYALQKDKHVNVDILFGRLSSRGQAVMNVFTFVLFFIFMYFFFTLALKQTITATVNHYASGTMWNPPIWPFKILVTFGVGLVLLQGVAKFIRDLVMAITGNPIEWHVGEEKG